MRTERTDENVYLCGMDYSRLLSTILPEALIDNFGIVSTKKSATRFDIWLQEKPLLSKEDQRSGQVISNGFGDYRVIQDYPLRGRTTYLHVRKRRWPDKQTGEIFSYDIDVSAYDGTNMNSEFVSFSKGGY